MVMGYISMVFSILIMVLTLSLLIGLIILVTHVIILVKQVNSDIPIRAKMRAFFANDLAEIIPSLKEIARNYAGKTSYDKADSENNTKS